MRRERPHPVAVSASIAAVQAISLLALASPPFIWLTSQGPVRGSRQRSQKTLRSGSVNWTPLRVVIYEEAIRTATLCL
jgi:hypothetical protein